MRTPSDTLKKKEINNNKQENIITSNKIKNDLSEYFQYINLLSKKRPPANVKLIENYIKQEKNILQRICFIEIDESKIELTLGESIKLFYNGEPANYNEKEAKNYMKNKNIYLSINLNLGIHNETIYTCDLSDEYVKINSGYTS